MTIRIEEIPSRFVDDEFARSTVFNVLMEKNDVVNGGMISIEVRGRSLPVKLPAGILETGTRIRLKNALGDNSEAVAPENDVYLFITVVEEVKVTLLQSLLQVFFRPSSPVPNNSSTTIPRAAPASTSAPTRPSASLSKIEIEFKNVFSNKSQKDHERIIVFWQQKKSCQREDAMRHAIDDLRQQTRSWR
jgi:hypothetical protein